MWKAIVLLFITSPAFAQITPGCESRKQPLSSEMQSWCRTHTPAIIAEQARLVRELSLHSDPTKTAKSVFQAEATALAAARVTSVQQNNPATTQAIDNLLQANSAAQEKAQ